MKHVNENAARVIKTGILFLAGFIISYLIASSRGFALGKPACDNAICWSDGFFAVGIVMAGIGGLVLIATTDFFDILSYGVYSLTHRFVKPGRRGGLVAYFDYKIMREQRRGKPRFLLLAVGLTFCLLSVACLVYARL